MTEPSTVIDLRTKTTYRPNCETLARNRILLARNSLGMSYSEFADLLTPVLGWPVSADAIEAWETTGSVPPGDVVIAVSTVTPVAVDRLGLRSHKFIATYVGESAARDLVRNTPAGDDGHSAISVQYPSGNCDLHVWPHGVAIFHLVEDLELRNVAHLAVWRYRSYEQNLNWATTHLRELTGDSTITAGYVLSLYWLDRPTWAGRMLDTAVRIVCTPRVLVDRDKAGSDDCLAAAEQAEQELLAEGFDHNGMRSFSLAGVSVGYASWSGVAYHPIDPARCLAEEDLVAYELRMQAIWAYCDHINSQVEQGRDPIVSDGYGWRFLRAARSRLGNPRPQETDQHRSMREAVLGTSGLAEHLQQAIEALREAGKS